MSVKIELGFTADGAGAPYFTLDNPVLGVLDNPNAYLGGGEIFADVSAYFKSFTISRGKSRELDRYEAGQASVVFDNSTRVFDPTFAASPFFGQIVPKRRVRITVDGIIQYLGVIDDWNINYEPGTNSEASLIAFDGFSFFANAELNSASYSVESTGDRLNNILDNLGWASSARNIGTTAATLEAQTISAGQQPLPIMQTIALSEPGDLFIAKNGDVKFVGRNTPLTSQGVFLSDDGSDVPYKTINAIYGSELLYNTATISSSVGTAIATSPGSVGIYGQRVLSQTTYLSSLSQLQTLADYLVIKYALPEYRFENVTIDLKAISNSDRTDVLGIELGDVVRVNFTPSRIPPMITRFGKVIGMVYRITPSSEEVSLQLQSTQGSLLILDDPIFGKLDTENILGW